MKVHWRYRCDYGHTWTLYRDENTVEQPEDVLCPYGHEAVTLRKDRPVDEVQIILRPAGLIVDPIKNQVVDEGKYWLVLTNLEGEEERVSERSYLWREVLKLAEQFHGKTIRSTWALWDKLRP